MVELKWWRIAVEPRDHRAQSGSQRVKICRLGPQLKRPQWIWWTRRPWLHQWIWRMRESHWSRTKKSGNSWWSQWRKTGYGASWDSSITSGNSRGGRARELDIIRESSMLTGTGGRGRSRKLQWGKDLITSGAVLTKTLDNRNPQQKPQHNICEKKIKTILD